MKNARQTNLIIFGVSYFCFMQEMTKDLSFMFPAVISLISILTLMLPDGRRDES